LSTGAVKCWGSNNAGQLGNGKNAPSNVPVYVIGLGDQVKVTAIMGGYWHTCALLSTGTVKCWGLNYDGQLGNETYDDSNVPVPVSNLSSGVIAILNHNLGRSSCAIVRND